MKNLFNALTRLLLLAALFLAATPLARASMTVQSLSGAVTATEISSFKTFMQTQSPPTTNTYDNNMADGTAGMNCEALGLMYEVTNAPAILNEMVAFADSFIALRNDYTDRRVMWTGRVEPVWLTKAASSSEAGYAGCENNDIVGHIAYCAKLILQSPSLWNTTVPDGNPHHYGVTYLQRATNYITQMEYSEAQYFNPNFINTGNDEITAPTSSAWTTFGESVNAWNRQMMFLNGWQRLSECHAILGDNPANETFYDAIVQASVTWFQSEWQTTNGGGQTCYRWQYAPSHSGGNEEMNGHAAYDMWGLNRAFVAAKYGMTQPLLRPFAETLQYIIYQAGTTYTFAEWVNGDTSKTRSYIYGQWMGISAYDPCVFSIMAQADINQGSQGSTPIYDAEILWVKNNRAIGFFPDNCGAADFSLYSPWVENITAGNATNFPVTVVPLDGFSANGVTLGMTGLPAGVTAGFSSPPNATLTLTASGTVSNGVYSATITGSGSGITRIVPITLVVTNPNVPSFSLSATPASQNIVVGASTNYTVTATPANGFSGTINLAISGLPAHANGSFSPSSISGGSGSSTLNLTTGTNTPDGTYTLTITGTSGSLTNTTTVTLAFNDFTISAAPSSQSVIAGNATNYTVSVGNVNGFGGTVTFSAGGLPAGATASFNPTSISMIGSSTMTITTAANTPVSTNTLTITGASGNLLHSATAGLVVLPVPDFSISASPNSQSVAAGNNTSFTATVTALNGFNGSTTFTVNGLPAGATGSFNPASVNGSGSSTLNITTTNTMAASTNTLTITGTSGSLVHTANVTLVVSTSGVLTWTTINDTDAGITYSAGWTYSTNRNDGDYNNDTHYTKTNSNYAQYTFTGTGIKYITETYSDESNVDVYIDGAYQTTVSCYSSTRQAQVVAYSTTGLSSGSHTIKVVKNGGTYMLLDAFAYATGTSPDFSISTTPASQTVVAGNSTNYTATVSAVNGFSGTVTFSVSGLPSGANGSFSPASVNGSGSSTLTVTTGTSTAPGTYTLTVTGASGSLSHSNTVTLVINAAPDFSLSTTPASQTVTAGSGTNYTATVGALNGFNGTVNFSVSGLPSGASGSFSPTSVSGSGSSSLSVTTGASTAPGTYTLTVAGTSGSLSHSNTVTLVVNPPPWTLVNDTDSGITYSAGWSYSATRGYGDYQDDVHYTKTNSMYAQYTFTGSGVEYITEMNTDEGNVDVYIDGVLQTTVNCNASSRQAQVVRYSNTSLAYGSHTIKIVKSSGSYMLLDAFGYR